MLTRRTNERIKIGKDIEIIITEVKGDTVRIGIIAPKEIPIFRAEVYEAIEQANQCATLAPETVDNLRNILRELQKKRDT